MHHLRQPLLIVAMVAALSLAGAMAQAASRDDAGSAPLPSRSASRPPTSRTRDGGSKPPAASRGWWGTAGALAAVLALVFLTAKVVKKSMPAATQTLPAEVVQVLGRKALDYRNTIHVVRLGSKLLVLGSSQAGLSPLSEITDPVEVDYLAGLCKREPASTLGDSFNLLFRKFQGTPEPAEALEPEPDAPDETRPDDSGPEEDSGPDPAVLRLQARLHQPNRREPGSDAGPSMEVVG